MIKRLIIALLISLSFSIAFAYLQDQYENGDPDYNTFFGSIKD